MNKLTEPKQGFWGSLARKAKSIIDDDNDPVQSHTPPGRTTTKAQIPDTETRGTVRHQVDSSHRDMFPYKEWFMLYLNILHCQTL